MEIYIRRNNEEFGPFSREVALEYVKQGVFQAGDRACYAGVQEWKTVGELLGISVTNRPGRSAEFTQTDKITEFNPSWTPNPEPPSRTRRRSELKRNLLIVLNSLLILIAGTVAAIRFIGGPEFSQHCVAALSVQFSRLANALSAPQPTPPPATPASAIQKPPPSAATPAPPTPPPAPSASPPATAEAPTPAPSAIPILSAAPIATPIPPPPPPKPFDPSDLQANPAGWPKTLTLKQPVIFPALFNSQVVGSITAQPGTEVNLVRIQGDQLVLEFNGGTQTVPWKWTDLQQRAAQTPSTAPAPPTLPGPAAPVGP